MLEIWLLFLLSVVKVQSSQFHTVRILPSSLEIDASDGYNFTLYCEYNITHHDFTTYSPNFEIRYNPNPCLGNSNRKAIYISRGQTVYSTEGQTVHVLPKEIPHNGTDSEFPLVGNITISVNGEKLDLANEVCGYAHYICIMRVEHETEGMTPAENNATISFTVRPEIQDVSSDVIAQEGQAVNLFCRGAGLPSPTVTWHRANGQPFPEHRRLIKYTSSDSNGNLRIPSIEAHHEGEYICTVDNRLNRPVNATVRITVEYKPVVSVGAAVVYQKLDYHTELECSAIANPEMSGHSWERHYSDGQVVENIKSTLNAYYELEAAMEKSSGGNNTYLMLSKELTSTLVIKSVQPQDYRGSFCCVFANELGDSSQCIEVAESDVPVAVNRKPPQYSPISGFAIRCPSQLLILCSFLLLFIIVSH